MYACKGKGNGNDTTESKTELNDVVANDSWKREELFLIGSHIKIPYWAVLKLLPTLILIILKEGTCWYSRWWLQTMGQPCFWTCFVIVCLTVRAPHFLTGTSVWCYVRRMSGLNTRALLRGAKVTRFCTRYEVLCTTPLKLVFVSVNNGDFKLLQGDPEFTFSIANCDIILKLILINLVPIPLVAIS